MSKSTGTAVGQFAVEFNPPRNGAGASPIGPILVKAHSNRTGGFLYPAMLGALQPQRKPQGSGNGSKHEQRAALRTLRLPVMGYCFLHSSFTGQNTF